MSQPDVSVVIVNYNTPDLTLACISSVIDKTEGIDYEIIVVDNASPDCDPQIFVEKFPSINLVVSKENGGFAKGNNLGLRVSRGRYILLLNSDTELLNNALLISKKYMDSHPAVGMMSGQLINPGGKIQKLCRRFRSISWELLELFPLYLFWSKEKKDRIMLHHYFDHQSEIECDWISGAYMFFRREILSRLPENKLAEDYFMYCEDVLWSWQVKELGYLIFYTPEPRIFHQHHGTVNKEKQLRIRRTIIKNHLDFMRRYYYRDWKFVFFKVIFLSKQFLIGSIEKFKGG